MAVEFLFTKQTWPSTPPSPSFPSNLLYLCSRLANSVKLTIAILSHSRHHPHSLTHLLLRHLFTLAMFTVYLTKLRCVFSKSICVYYMCVQQYQFNFVEKYLPKHQTQELCRLEPNLCSSNRSSNRSSSTSVSQVLFISTMYKNKEPH